MYAERRRPVTGSQPTDRSLVRRRRPHTRHHIVFHRKSSCRTLSASDFPNPGALTPIQVYFKFFHRIPYATHHFSLPCHSRPRNFASAPRNTPFLVPDHRWGTPARPVTLRPPQLLRFRCWPDHRCICLLGPLMFVLVLFIRVDGCCRRSHEW